MVSDHALLKEYSATRDADAFEALVARYSDMVYAVCLRITRNEHDAEDATQECFFSLAKKAGTVESSLPGWLHATARHASLAIVQELRKNKERQVAMAQIGNNGDGLSWKELRPHIDAAIQDLPEELQSCIILHYLQGKNQAEIAEMVGTDRSTVSRRLEKGRDELRKRLQKAGVAVTAAALVACLSEGTAHAAPLALKASLGKMALAGVGETATATGVGTAAAGSAVGAKIAAAIAVAVIVAGGVIGYKALTKPQQTPVPPAPKQIAAAPAAVDAAAQPIKEKIMARKPDYSKLALQGNGHEQDSFSLAVQAAARMLGKDVDYETVAALSGNVFAPCICTGESCKAWWGMYERSRGIRFHRCRLGRRHVSCRAQRAAGTAQRPPGGEGQWHRGVSAAEQAEG